MKESLILGINAVSPLLIFMLIGYIFKLRKMFSEITFVEMNRAVFRLFLPAVLFINVYESDLQYDFNAKLLVFAIAAVFIIFGLCFLLVNIFSRKRVETPVLIQGLYRSNFVLFGVAVTESVCGAGNIGMTTIMAAVIVPLYNIIAVVLFEGYRSSELHFLRTVREVLKNPMIIATMLGIFLKLLSVEIPEIGMNIIASVGKLATSLALLALGGTLTFEGLKKHKKKVLLISLGRLVIIPVIFVLIGIGMGFRNGDLVSLMVMLAAPTAVSSFAMAGEMGGDKELAGLIVVMTSVLSVFTIFLWIYFLSINGLI